MSRVILYFLASFWLSSPATAQPRDPLLELMPSLEENACSRDLSLRARQFFAQYRKFEWKRGTRRKLFLGEARDLELLLARSSALPDRASDVPELLADLFSGAMTQTMGGVARVLTQEAAEHRLLLCLTPANCSVRARSGATVLLGQAPFVLGHPVPGATWPSDLSGNLPFSQEYAGPENVIIARTLEKRGDESDELSLLGDLIYSAAIVDGYKKLIRWFEIAAAKPDLIFRRYVSYPRGPRGAPELDGRFATIFLLVRAELTRFEFLLTFYPLSEESARERVYDSLRKVSKPLETELARLGLDAKNIFDFFFGIDFLLDDRLEHAREDGPPNFSTVDRDGMAGTPVENGRIPELLDNEIIDHALTAYLGGLANFDYVVGRDSAIFPNAVYDRIATQFRGTHNLVLRTAEPSRVAADPNLGRIVVGVGPDATVAEALVAQREVELWNELRRFGVTARGRRLGMLLPENRVRVYQRALTDFFTTDHPELNALWRAHRSRGLRDEELRIFVRPYLEGMRWSMRYIAATHEMYAEAQRRFDQPRAEALGTRYSRARIDVQRLAYRLISFSRLVEAERAQQFRKWLASARIRGDEGEVARLARKISELEATPLWYRLLSENEPHLGNPTNQRMRFFLELVNDHVERLGPDSLSTHFVNLLGNVDDGK